MNRTPLIFFRSLVFSIVIAVWSISFGTLMLPILLLPPIFSRLVGGWWSLTILCLAKWICGINWEMRGYDKVPKGPVIFAAKHQSAWDTLFFPACIREPTPVAKAELRMIPLYGWFSWRAEAIWIDRATGGAAIRKMIRGARAAIKAGRPVFIFPQGTRTQPGEARAYQPGVAALYSGTDVPVVPVALNSGMFWGRRAFLKRPGTIVVEFLPALPPGLGRDEFLTALEAAVEPATARLEAAAGLAGQTTN